VIRVYVATDDATGVIRGTEVWDSGERIGEVERTTLRPVTVDTSQRVLVRIAIPRDLAPRIRRDTRAQIRPGSSMLGSPVVYFSGGTANAPGVRDGDTLVAQPQSAFDETRAAVAVAVDQIPALRADVESLTSQLFSRSGTIGAVNTRDIGDRRVTVLDALTRDLKQRTRAAKPRVLDSARATLLQGAQRALAATDSLRHLMTLAGGTLDRLERDSAFVRAVRNTRAEIDSTQRLLTTPVGTAGRLRSDSALRHQLSEASRSLPF
jgi:enamine deaminase RidA (YjgF/YER057c/UK114 family)